MRLGFTLIELLLAVSFSLILITTLFNSFFQMTRVVHSADQLMDNDTRISTINNQFERDISGIFVPVQAITEAIQPQTTPGSAQAQPEKKSQPLQKVFYSTNKENVVSALTFITNNPIRIYEKNKQGTSKPCIVRVVYTLVKEKEAENSYALMRQEGTDLNYDAYKAKASKPIIAYQLAERIKSITVEYKVPEQKNSKASEDNNPIKYDTHKEWPGKQQADKPPLIPQFITFKMILWDAHRQNEYEYTLDYSIAAFDSNKALSFKATSTAGTAKDLVPSTTQNKTGKSGSPRINPFATTQGSR